MDRDDQPVGERIRVISARDRTDIVDYVFVEEGAKLNDVLVRTLHSWLDLALEDHQRHGEMVFRGAAAVIPADENLRPFSISIKVDVPGDLGLR